MDNPIDVEIIPDEIVRCPQCGSRNRLLKQKRRVAYRCGGCAAPLENPFAMESIIKRRFQEIARRISTPNAGKLLGLLVVGMLVLAAVLRNRDHRPSPESDKGLSPPAKTLTIESSPSPPPPPQTPAVPPRSLENGTILTELTTIGHGTFIIHNDSERDTVIKLVDEAARRSVVSVYVTAYHWTTIDEVPDDRFAVLCGQGVDWDDNAGDFKREKSFGKFDQDFDFTMKIEQTEQQIIHRYKSITLEIAPSIAGNITRSAISEKTFLEY